MKLDFIKNYKQHLLNFALYSKYSKEFLYKIEPLITKWKLLSNREKNLFLVLGSVFILYLVMSVFFGIINLVQDVEIKNTNLYSFNVKANYLQKEYENISQFHPNKFSEVNVEKVKDDMKQILDIKDETVTLEDGMLIIKGENVQFEKVIQLLGQLKNTYGIFPSKLLFNKIQPDIVNFNISFVVK